MLTAVLFFGIVTVLSFEGVRLCRRFPWNPDSTHLGVGLGLALTPFVWGLSVLTAMAALPHSSGWTHLFVSFILYFGVTRVTSLAFKAPKSFKSAVPEPEKKQWFFYSITALFSLLFLLALVATPLTQNDGLEYLIVGKHLFQTHNIFSYPLIHPEQNYLNFYGPWTHPPLYPALLYAANVVQNNFQEIGLTRWISPWFFLSSIFLLAAIPWKSSKNLSLLTFSLCLSVPLWSLGATTALIDACTLAAYITLFVVVCGLDPQKSSYAILVGVVSGLGMWAHSQAILNPLVFVFGFLYLFWKTPGRFVKNALIAGCIALSLGGIYYIRNVLLFGNPIKDASPVAQIKALDMNPYFMVSRGYYHLIDVLRFGYLKMWFSYEAYNLIPWLFLFTLIFYFLKGRFSQSNSQRSFLNPSLVITVGLFLSIVAVSILGSTHYLKNERYQMILLPLMICFAIQALINSPARSKKIQLTLQGLVGLCLAMSLLGQILFLKKSWAEQSSLIPGKVFSQTTDFLNAWKQWHLNKKILSYKPADSFLNDLPTTSHVDPVLIPLYQLSSPDESYQWLKDNGFGFIYIPTYLQPTDYNTALVNLIGNPKYTELIGEGPDSQLYRINDSIQKPAMTPLQHGQNSQEAFFTLGGRKDLIALPASALHSWASWLRYLREWTEQKTLVFVDNKNISIIPRPFTLQMFLKGFGNVTAQMLFFDANNSLISKKNVADMALMNPDTSLDIQRQVYIPQGTHTVKIQLRTKGLDYLTEFSGELLAPVGNSSL